MEVGSAVRTRDGETLQPELGSAALIDAFVARDLAQPFQVLTHHLQGLMDAIKALQQALVLRQSVSPPIESTPTPLDWVASDHAGHALCERSGGGWECLLNTAECGGEHHRGHLRCQRDSDGFICAVRIGSA